MPENMSAEGRDLVDKLLKRTPDDRISIDDIKKHEFFSGIDFNTILAEESPLLNLYDRINENHIALCSSDSDSFANEDSFDHHFDLGNDHDGDLGHDHNDHSAIGSHKHEKYLKKSSSLNENRLLELIPVKD